MPPFGYALIVAGVIALLGWGEHERAGRLSQQLEAVELERDQARVDKQAADDAADRAAQAQQQLNARITTLRSDYEKRAHQLAAIPGHDACLDRDLPPALDGLLGSAGVPGAAEGAPADARPTTGAGVAGTNLSRPGGLRAAPAGDGTCERGGQGRGAGCV